MGWHILKKDVRLLWLAAAALAITEIAIAILRSWLGLFPHTPQLGVLADVLSIIAVIGVAILTLAAMHQDAVPDPRQDWLIRPIKPLDMILAKLCFVLLLVQAPLFIADLMEGLLQGFSFPAAAVGAAERNLTVLCLLTLPALLFGVVTRSLAQAFAVAAAALVLYLAVFLVGTVMLFGVRTSVGGTGLAWLVEAFWAVVAIIGTAIVMGLQLFRRATTFSRALIFAGGGAVILSAFLPWHLAFALQETLAKEPGAARPVDLSFYPQLGPVRLPTGAAAPRGTVIYLPLRVGGLPRAGLLLLDRANVRITDRSGRTLYEGRSNLSVDGVGSILDARLEVRQQGDAPVDVHQRIFLPADVYAQLRDQPITLEVDESLTLFRSQAKYSLPAAGGDVQLAGLGRCASRVDADGDDVLIHCEDPIRVPTCFTAELEDSSGSLHNPERDLCDPDYSPVQAAFWPDTLHHLHWGAPFFDRAGLVHYPVDGSRIDGARLLLQTYEPRDHFTRRITVHDVRLADFVAPHGT
jgi:hypothetical protein